MNVQATSTNTLTYHLTGGGSVPLTYRNVIETKEGKVVEIRTLPAEEQERLKRGITDRFMEALGYTVKKKAV